MITSQRQKWTISSFKSSGGSSNIPLEKSSSLDCVQKTIAIGMSKYPNRDRENQLKRNTQEVRLTVEWFRLRMSSAKGDVRILSFNSPWNNFRYSRSRNKKGHYDYSGGSCAKHCIDIRFFFIQKNIHFTYQPQIPLSSPIPLPPPCLNLPPATKPSSSPPKV